MESNQGHPAGCNCCAEENEKDPLGMDLFQVIDHDHLYCLNAQNPKTCKEVFRQRNRMHDHNVEPIVSDEEDGPVLIFYVPFTCTVKLKSINIIGGSDCKAPSKAKLYINQEAFDFSILEEESHVQELELVENPVGQIYYPLKVTKFMNVNNLVIAIPENFGADITEIKYIGIKGEKTNMKRQVVIATYESKPIMADHKNPLKDMMGGNLMH